MDITVIDENFKKSNIDNFSYNVFTLPNENFLILGGYYDEKLGFIKMPLKQAKQVSEGVAWGARCTAGIRILFSTNSKTISISGTILSKCLMEHMAFIGSAGFTLCEVDNGKEKFVCNLVPSMDLEESMFFAQGLIKGKKVRDYILYLPLYSGVGELTISLDKRSVVKPYNKYVNLKPILYYGSSITQGACASRANDCYQALVSEWNNVDYYILGFSGNAKGEEKMVEYLANFDCSVFVCDYDYNAPTVEHLAKTHLALYKKFRSVEKNKTTPIVFITKPDGFKNSVGNLRYEIIKATYDYAKVDGDDNVYLIDGRKIYPKEIREHCSIDGCHPTDLGFYFFAKKVHKVINEILKKGN